MQIQDKIAAGLERAFVQRGFAEPSVDELREAAGVSLRTLYKYTPSRADMVRAALEYRNIRYKVRIFDNLPERDALDEILSRIAGWMSEEAAQGCLFHAAVAAAPRDASLRAMLDQHKRDCAACAAKAARLSGAEVELILLMDGLMQTWPMLGDSALSAAQAAGRDLLSRLGPRSDKAFPESAYP